ncbi:hypothetical protein PRIPAC_72103 [Pristionchus pacificus]|uniref:Uncharacterized protein n=1 Tax=Pristionchus pacificus TaxID=54126 RepID=A0A2A6CSV8_PRIPA|nr:hypothetical protein PRIPAC_72103 [Pristionchus pacificus]|eukprot:PDM81188.1 hypothetical protein PRIPAC_36191 [Pristionchus pacificus]
MKILLLNLLLTVASAVQLVEHFECGSAAVWGSVKAAQALITYCNYAVKDDANLCCKEHDLCYELHEQRNHTREFCDARFCNCLQDVSDRSKNYDCKFHMSAFCVATIRFGEGSFDKAVPHIEADIEAKFVGFEDARPFGLDMQRLVDACLYTKGIAVHCHNTVHTCLQSKHERFKRLIDVVEYSYQDCRSTMHDCMQMIIESEKDTNCSAVARDIAMQANTYMELNEARHGRSIIETYPIVSARLIKQCNESNIEPCLPAFDHCAVHNPPEHPELLNAARKINIECHRQLSGCIEIAAIEETSEDCIEAQNLAVGRIRNKDIEPVPTVLQIITGYSSDWLEKHGWG